jgi:tetratricopeptide (TPR) repeat protein
MQQRRALAFILSLSLSLVVSAPASAQGKKAMEATEVANQAIEELAAWNLKAAGRTLNRAEGKFGSTPEYQTAWALYEAMNGLAGNSSQLDTAMQSLEARSKANRFAPVADYWRGEILYGQGNNSAAGAAWKAALRESEGWVESDQGNATAQFYLGAALVRNKQYEPARKALEKAEEFGFDRAMVQHQIGLSYLFSQTWGPARKAFDAAIEAEKTFAPSYFWRAMAWDKLGRKDNMLIDLDQFVKLAPDAPEAGKAKAVLASAGR